MRLYLESVDLFDHANGTAEAFGAGEGLILVQRKLGHTSAWPLTLNSR